MILLFWRWSFGVLLSGPHFWPLPKVEVEYPDELDKYKWFAKVFLEGAVCPKLKVFIPTLLTAPSTMLKTWAKWATYSVSSVSEAWWFHKSSPSCIYCFAIPIGCIYPWVYGLLCHILNMSLTLFQGFLRFFLIFCLKSYLLLIFLDFLLLIFHWCRPWLGPPMVGAAHGWGLPWLGPPMVGAAHDWGRPWLRPPMVAAAYGWFVYINLSKVWRQYTEVCLALADFNHGQRLSWRLS